MVAAEQPEGAVRVAVAGEVLLHFVVDNLPLPARRRFPEERAWVEFCMFDGSA